jgi:hypothetical protein
MKHPWLRDLPDGDGPKATIQDLKAPLSSFPEPAISSLPHVIDGVQDHAHSCPVTAIYLRPIIGIRIIEELSLVPFAAAIASSIAADVAMRLHHRLRAGKESFEIRPNSMVQPAGRHTHCIHRFPLESRDP